MNDDEWTPGMDAGLVMSVICLTIGLVRLVGSFL